MVRRVPSLVVALTCALAGSLLVATATAGPVAADEPAAAPVATVTAGAFTSIAAQRVLDTRSGNGAPVGPVAKGGTVSFVVAGRGGVPADGVGAVALTVTVVSPGASGYAVAFAAGGSRPASSTVNFSAGRTASNLVVVPVGAGGRVSVFSSAPTHVVVDVSGWYAAGTPTQAGMYGAVTPSRVLDTRNGTGAAQRPVAARTALTVALGGRGGIPSSGVAAVLLNVTATAPTAAGYVTAYAAGTTRPNTSIVNYVAGQTVADLVLAPVSTDGRVALYTSATTHLVADVAGYQLGGTAATPGAFHALAPTRLLDTRGAGGAPGGRSVEVATAGRGGVPRTDVAAVAVVVTALSFDRPGGVVVFRGSGAAPATTNLSFAAHQTIANSVLAPVGPDGRVRLRGSADVSLVVDVVGWVGRAAAPSPTWNAVTPVDTFGGEVTAVGCASATLCDAVDGHGQTVRFDGTSWSAPTSLTHDDLVGVACPTATLCIARSGFGEIWTDDGSTWTEQGLDLGEARNGFSCTAPTFCVAGDDLGRVYWSSDLAVYRIAQPFPSTDAVVDTACADPTSCVAITGSGRISAFDGTSWSTGALVAGSPRLRAVSCAATTCVAVGSDATGAHGVALRRQDGAWQVDGTLPVTAPLTDVSCTGTTCVAVDDAGVAYAQTAAAAWHAVGATGGDGARHVSCGTPQDCVLVTESGHAVRWDGTALVDPQDPDPATSLFRALSCVSGTSCTAVGSGGDVRHFDGTGWTTTDRLTGLGDFSALSCASETWCAVVDRDGRAALRGADGWGPVRTVVAGVPFVSVSCPVEGFCLAGAQDGRIFAADAQGWRVAVTLPTRSAVELACTGPTWCLAHVGGASYRWDGSSWTVIAGAAGVVSGIACASQFLCVEGTSRSSNENAGVQYDGVGWDTGQVLSATSDYLDHPTCAPGGTCVLPSEHRVFATNGVTWAADTITGLSDQITAASCAADGFCLVVDARNKAFAAIYR